MHRQQADCNTLEVNSSSYFEIQVSKDVYCVGKIRIEGAIDDRWIMKNDKKILGVVVDENYCFLKC